MRSPAIRRAAPLAYAALLLVACQAVAPSDSAPEASYHDGSMDGGTQVADAIADNASPPPSDAGRDAAKDANPNTPPPVLVSTSPAADATLVLLGAAITATFSKPLDPGTVTSTTFTLRSTVSPEAPLAGTIEVSGSTVSFEPAAPLESGTTYSAEIGRAVTDEAHIALAESLSWSFTTVPAPTVETAYPLDGKVGVGTGGTVTLVFSAPMNVATVSVQPEDGPCTGAFQVHAGGDICVGGSVAASNEDRTFVFTPATSFASETNHTVTIGAAATSSLGAPAIPYAMVKGFFTTRFVEDARIIYPSVQVRGDFGGAAGGDAVCSGPASRPVGVVAAKAILTDSTRVACTVPNCGDGNVQTNWALHPSTNYVRKDGVFLFTTDEHGIFTSYPMGAALSNSGINFWDALWMDWTSHAQTCADWTSAAATSADCYNNPACGAVGWTAIADASWITGGLLPCSSYRPLACAEW